MEENKVLFSVVKKDEGSAVRLDACGSEELFAVALGIHQLIDQCPELTFMLSALIAMSKDEEFKKKLEGSTIDMPDFDAILKNTK